MEDGNDLPPRLHIDPPLLNSANPWATTLEQLRALHGCASTGAVTTRTALLDGFPHDEAVHRFAFFEAGSHRVVGDGGGSGGGADASLNTLGYSPVPLEGYLRFIRTIDEELKAEEDTLEKDRRAGKPFLVSVTGAPDDVAECYARVARCAAEVVVPLALEINLSCPNIPGKPPPAYDGDALEAYLARVARAVGESRDKAVPWGVKTPPYTHAGQFEMFGRALREAAVGKSGNGNEGGEGENGGNSEGGAGRICPLSFVTATNTLGSCLLLSGSESGRRDTDGLALAPVLGVGGVAGAPLHPLALGNVDALRRMLDAYPETRHVDAIGVGGVADAAGYRRMRSVGAAAVGVGTALGIRGLEVFREIEEGVGGVW